MHYKVVFIDWDGTLSNSRFWDRWKGTNRYNEIQSVLFEERKDLLYDWMTGSISYVSILRYIEKCTGISYQELKDELILSSKSMRLIDPEVLVYISSLRKKGVKVVIATDNMDTFRKHTIPSMKLDDLFDEVMTSDDISALKTEFYDDGRSKFFDEYLNENKISEHEALLIDNSHDVKIIERAGIDFAHVNENMTLLDHLKRMVF